MISVDITEFLCQDICKKVKAQCEQIKDFSFDIHSFCFQQLRYFVAVAHDFDYISFEDYQDLTKYINDFEDSDRHAIFNLETSPN